MENIHTYICTGTGYTGLKHSSMAYCCVDVWVYVRTRAALKDKFDYEGSIESESASTIDINANIECHNHW